MQIPDVAGCTQLLPVGVSVSCTASFGSKPGIVKVVAVAAKVPLGPAIPLIVEEYENPVASDMEFQLKVTLFKVAVPQAIVIISVGLIVTITGLMSVHVVLEPTVLLI